MAMLPSIGVLLAQVLCNHSLIFQGFFHGRTLLHAPLHRHSV